MRYFYVFDGKPVYDINKTRLRIKILLELLKMEGNMEAVAPIFEESNGKV